MKQQSTWKPSTGRTTSLTDPEKIAAVVGLIEAAYGMRWSPATIKAWCQAIARLKAHPEDVMRGVEQLVDTVEVRDLSIARFRAIVKRFADKRYESEAADRQKDADRAWKHLEEPNCGGKVLSIDSLRNWAKPVARIPVEQIEDKANRRKH